MPKRPAPGALTPKGARKRGRPGRKRDGEEGEKDEELLHQLRRRQIIEGNDDEEEWVREMEQEEGGHMLEDIYIPPKITRTEHPFTGERLVIDKIVCENFKSYGGVKEMGPFHKSFSAIIGPNGNGKSNIIDALLFVFGYRASKIRCKKVSTLIHTSELLPNCRSCAVTVHFCKIMDTGDDKDGGDDFEVVPGSRIQVRRKAFSDSSSKYYLNGKAVKFQEIAKFLKSNGVDLTHNRFLILQGEVEQIAQMPPIGSAGNDGLLEFLEDIIGTRRYIRPLAMLEERVETLDYERDEKLQRVDKAEKEKMALVEPVKKCKEYLRDQNSKIRYQNMLFHKQIYEAKKRMSQKEETKGKLEERMQEIQGRLDEILSNNQQRRQELTVAEKEFKSLEKEYVKAKKKFDEADAEFTKLNQELQRSNESRKKLKKEVEKLKAEIEKLMSIPENHKKEIEALAKRKLELTTDIQKEEEAIKDDLEQLNTKVEEALRMKEVTDRKFAKQKELRDVKKAACDKLQKALNILKDREANEKKKLDQLQRELEILKENINRKEREGRTSIGGSRVQQMEQKLQELANEEKTLTENEAEKKAVYEHARDEFRSAQESLDGNNQMDQVDRALLEAKADGTLRGLYGRLKNLAKIPEKYNIAATVSTGMLDYWITDNDDTAGNCITFLRENNLSVQNFMCLSRLQNYVRQAKERFDTPQDSKRIFDLLEISNPVLVPAYYKAFRNTLVADNIDIATKVSYGGSRRHRVATLKGEIVEVTGSMVGGGRPITEGKFNKRAGISITKQQVAALKKNHDNALAAYQEVHNERQKATEATRKLSEEVADVKRKINNFTSDLTALKDQLPLKEAAVQSQEKKLKENTLSPTVLKGKEAEIDEATEEYEALTEPFEEAKADAKRINDKVHDLKDVKQKEITKKLDKLNDQLKKLQDELNKKNVELKNCETNKKKCETKLAKAEQEIETLQKKMEETNTKRKEVEALAKEIKGREEELVGLVDQAKQKYEEMKKGSFENDKEEKSLTKEKVTLEQQYSDAKSEVKGCQHSLKTLEESLQGLKLYDIPEEDVEPLKQFTDEEIKPYAVPELDRKIKKYTDKIKSRPTPNLNILDEYKEKIDTLMERIKDLEDITTRRDKFREALCKLDQQRSTEFMEGFALISSRLKEMFRMISMGGDAELEVVDTLDLFGCGINFSVRPARKTWKKISNLSGGEKTLASLSLVFALHHFKPSPFYVMDEIDAALDFKNVSIIANYIKDRTKFTQFVIISLRSNMFELADSLLGVYKVDNMSYCIHFGVKKIVADLKRKIERGRHSTGAKATTTAGTQSQPAAVGRGSPTPGPSQKRAIPTPQQEKRPDLDISSITDDEDDDTGKDDSSQMERSVIEKTILAEEYDDVLTPPERVCDAPAAAVEQAAIIQEASIKETDITGLAKPQKRQSLPKFTSTPFTGRHLSEPKPKRNQSGGGGFDSDEDEDDESMDVDQSPEVSPIRGQQIFANTPASSQEQNNDSDEPETLGPSP